MKRTAARTSTGSTDALTGASGGCAAGPPIGWTASSPTNRLDGPVWPYSESGKCILLSSSIRHDQLTANRFSEPQARGDILGNPLQISAHKQRRLQFPDRESKNRTSRTNCLQLLALRFQIGWHLLGEGDDRQGVSLLQDVTQDAPGGVASRFVPTAISNAGRSRSSDPYRAVSIPFVSFYSKSVRKAQDAHTSTVGIPPGPCPIRKNPS